MTLRFARAIIASAVLAATAACGGGGGGGGGGNPPPPALNITATSLPSGVLGAPYSATITATGGTGARTFAITAGALPAGLALNGSTGGVSGTPSGVTGVSNFTVTVTDSGTPQQGDSQALSITVNAVAAGRNDTIATATAIGNGTFSASISPIGDPNTVISPDGDFYRITTTASSTVTVDINARIQGSPLDSVIELVNGSGTRLNTCVSPAFNSACVHDDEQLGVVLDSFLQVSVTGATTFYVHVVDFRGDARPDMTYDLVVSGIN